MRLIDVDALIDKIHDKGEYRRDNYEIIDLIEFAPVVDIRRDAYWVKEYDVSKLGKYATEYTPKWYCSWCGQSSHLLLEKFQYLRKLSLPKS